MKRRMISCLVASLLVFAVRASADLVVDLDASSLAPGSISEWANAGSAGGKFLKGVPTDPNIVVETVDGRQAVTFSGVWMQSDFTTPAALTGNHPWSVLVWAHRTSGTGEDSMIQWADRGVFGCAHFNYGTRAITLWNDVFYSPAPPNSEWVHLAVTYDGATVALYVNGLPNATAARALNITPNCFMRLAIALPDVYGTHPFNGSLARVRMHDQALSASEVASDAGRLVAAEITPEAVVVGEDGTTADFTVQLNAGPLGPPTADVSVTLTPIGNTSDVKLGDALPGEAATVVFASGIWDTPQTLTVSAVDDAAMELAETFSFAVSVTSADTNYDGQIVLPPVVKVSVEDNDRTDNPVPTVYRDGFLLDKFDIARDYLAYGTDETPWDGYVVGGSPVSNVQINASLTTDGVLRLQSANGSWAGNDTTRGPFLYQLVEGDFIAEVYIAGYANSIEAQDPVYWNDCGIMVRVANIADAGPGEDDIQCSYFPVYGGAGNMIRYNDNGARTDGVDMTGDGFAADRWLRVERRGNAFFCSHSLDGVAWRTFPTAYPLIRDDMNLPVLQVGLQQATYTADTGWAEFENFRIRTAVGRITGDATVFEIGETSDTVDVQLNHAPGTDITVQLSAAAAGDNPLSDPTDIRINDSEPGQPAVLTFTPGNWDAVQTVTVTAVGDEDQEGLQLLALVGEVVGDANTCDPNFVGGWFSSLATIQVRDNLPGLNVAETSDSTAVAENGGVDEFTVALVAQPRGAVTVSCVDTSDPKQVTVNPAVLTFTPGDYNQPQTVTVAAIDDALPEDDPHGTTIMLTASSGEDAGYEGLEATVGVSIAENDCGAWGTHWADVNKDCVVNIADIAILAADWLACTTPNEPGCVDMR